MGRPKASGKSRTVDKTPSDRVTAEPGRHPFDADAIVWLIGQAIARLNSSDEVGQISYKRAVELLALLDASKAFGTVLKSVPREDVPLRWSLLYVLSETGDLKAADLFAHVASEPIRVQRDPAACESVYDGEVLVRTMAIEALADLAARDSTLVERLYDVLQAQPDDALRIEAIKGILAADPAETKRLKKLLPRELHFAMKLERVGAEQLSVEIDSNVVETGPPPPRLKRPGGYPVIHHESCCQGG